MKRLSCALAALLAALCLTGCGASKSFAAVEENYASAPAYGDSYSSTYTADGSSGTTSVVLPQSSARKIVYTANLTLESKDYLSTRDQILDALGKVGGYVESSGEGGSADTGTRWANYTLRVPADHYADFLSTVSETGSLTAKNESTDDITGAYVDVEARLESLRSQRDRLNELADSAETTADLLEIESQLTEVQYQIESYTAQQRVYDDQIDYSTVNVSLSEVQVYSPTTDSFLSRLGNAFHGGWLGFVAGIQALILVLVSLWPLLMLLVVIGVIVWQAAAAAKRRRLARAQAACAAAAARQNPPVPPAAKPEEPK